MSAPATTADRLGGRDLRSTLVAVAALTRVGTVLTGVVLCLVGARLAHPAAGAASPGSLSLLSAPTSPALLSLPASPATLAAVSVMIALAIAFAQVVNDVLDVGVDRLHKPHRPLVAGALSVRSAEILAAVLAGGALLAGALAAPVFLAGATVLLAASWAYSRWWKDTVLAGNVAVAALASTPLAFGAAAAGRVGAIVVAAQAVVLVFMVAFEVVKTGRDAAADGAAGLRTVATRHGTRATALLACALCVAFAGAAALPAMLAERPWAYAVVMGAGALVPTLGAAALLARRASEAEPFRAPFRLLRLAWFAGVGSLVLL